MVRTHGLGGNDRLAPLIILAYLHPRVVSDRNGDFCPSKCPKRHRGKGFDNLKIMMEGDDRVKSN